jgi:hypothetical protein
MPCGLTSRARGSHAESPPATYAHGVVGLGVEGVPDGADRTRLHTLDEREFFGKVYVSIGDGTDTLSRRLYGNLQIDKSWPDAYEPATPRPRSSGPCHSRVCPS